MTDNIEIPVPEVHQPSTTIVEAPRQELEHVVEHEGRITRIEEEHARHVQAVAQQIESVRSDLYKAIEDSRLEQASMLENKLTRLEELADKLEKQVVEVPESAIEELNSTATQAVPLVPEVEEPEKQVKETITRHGLRLRRKQRHGKQ